MIQTKFCCHTIKEQQNVAGTSDFDKSWGTTDLNKVLHGHLDLLLVLFTLGKLGVDLAPQAYQQTESREIKYCHHEYLFYRANPWRNSFWGFFFSVLWIFAREKWNLQVIWLHKIIPLLLITVYLFINVYSGQLVSLLI